MNFFDDLERIEECENDKLEVEHRLREREKNLEILSNDILHSACKPQNSSVTKISKPSSSSSSGWSKGFLSMPSTAKKSSDPNRNNNSNDNPTDTTDNKSRSTQPSLSNEMDKKSIPAVINTSPQIAVSNKTSNKSTNIASSRPKPVLGQVIERFP